MLFRSVSQSRYEIQDTHTNHHPKQQTQPPGQHQKHQKDDVELLLNHKRPQIQEQLEFGHDIKITRLAQQRKINNEQRNLTQMCTQANEFVRKQQHPTNQPDRDQHHHQDRQNTTRTTEVETCEAEITNAQFSADLTDDQGIVTGKQIGRASCRERV